jgi:hypothetical protein
MYANDSLVQSLQKLKDLLDAGALTRQEYELLKHKIIAPLLDKDDAASAAPDNDLVVTPDPLTIEMPSAGPLKSSELEKEQVETAKPSKLQLWLDAANVKIVKGTEETAEPLVTDLSSKLEVDHLLAAEEDNLGTWQEMTPVAALDQASGSGGFGESPATIPKAPGKKDYFADSGFLRSPEPRTRFLGRDRTLDLMLVVSILVLAGFGAFIYFDQQKWESEHIISQRTERAGGLAPLDKKVDFPSPAVSPSEARTGGEWAPAAAPASPDPASTPAVAKKKAVPAAPAPDAAKPAAPPNRGN